VARLTLVPVLVATAVFTGAGYGVTVVLPASDTATTRRTADTPEYTKGAVHGRQIYAGEGCAQCHTRGVRDTASDAGLAGRPTRPGDTLADRPALLGDVRYGPDLRCIGDRVPGVAAGATEDDKIAAMVAYLAEPADYHHGSTMPSYRFLPSTELRRLATFLVAQTCPEAAE
jgi:cbb3-type cytochrome oxidase cytochrome c subunit